jgi:predicted O-methyltransferase YrrM
MQLASMFVRAVSARTILDLGCGIGYSTFSLAKAAVPGAALTAIDSDPGHIELAQAACSRLGLEDRVSFVVGHVAEVLRTIEGPVDAVHDDAWFASGPPHLQAMLGLLRPGGLLTMPNGSCSWRLSQAPPETTGSGSPGPRGRTTRLTMPSDSQPGATWLCPGPSAHPSELP